MKYLKEFNDYMRKKYQMDKYPLNELLMELFEKYNKYEYHDDLPNVRESDVIESLEMIEGDGKVITSSNYPRYEEHFDNWILIIFGYRGGLINKVYYQYEIKVIDKSSERTSYGDFVNFKHYDTAAMMYSDNCPQIVDKEVISKVINDFKEQVFLNNEDLF
mgnify:CR=1 FL=1